jgi:hypothetical protein
MKTTMSKLLSLILFSCSSIVKKETSSNTDTIKRNYYLDKYAKSLSKEIDLLISRQGKDAKIQADSAIYYEKESFKYN